MSLPSYSFSSGIETQERAEYACFVFPFIRKNYMYNVQVAGFDVKTVVVIGVRVRATLLISASITKGPVNFSDCPTWDRPKFDSGAASPYRTFNRTLSRWFHLQFQPISDRLCLRRNCWQRSSTITRTSAWGWWWYSWIGVRKTIERRGTISNCV